jgi:DNA-directed RNA polymerase specialized sigma24 family protein
MIEQLALKDSLWRKIALKICKDETLSDDLVQDMYLKLYDCKKEINDFYVIRTIRNLFLDYIKQKNNVSIDLFYNFEEINNHFEPDDYELSIIQDCEKLPFLQNGLLKESYDLSIREISKKYKHIDYGLIYRELDKARKTVLGNDIDLYKNKRLKNGKK